jgi:hypothetical protein
MLAHMTVKVRLTMDLETDGQTDAEELGWILNLLRFELAHWPRWRGKIRRVEMLNPGEQACRASSAAGTPAPSSPLPESAQG